MYLEDILKSPLNFEEKFLKLKVDMNIGSFLGSLCSRLDSSGVSDIPPTQPIGNAQPSPENTARDKLEQHWRGVIRNASDLLAENENPKEKFQKQAIDEQMKKAQADQEYLKENSEAITAIDQEVPDGVIVHVDPYILQVKGSKMDFSRVLSSMMAEYFLPKFALVSTGKAKVAGLEHWEEAFWKAASKSGSKPDTSETDFPVDADLWNSSRSLFGTEGATQIRQTVEPLERFNEKVHKYATAAITKLTMILVDVTSAEPKEKTSALEIQGNNIRRYLELSVEISQVYQLLLKFCLDKYNLCSSVVHGVTTYYMQTQNDNDEKSKEEIASEMAALQF
jgi:hypothetical protein